MNKKKTDKEMKTHLEKQFFFLQERTYTGCCTHYFAIIMQTPNSHLTTIIITMLDSWGLEWFHLCGEGVEVGKEQD